MHEAGNFTNLRHFLLENIFTLCLFMFISFRYPASYVLFGYEFEWKVALERYFIQLLFSKAFESFFLDAATNISNFICCFTERSLYLWLASVAPQLGWRGDGTKGDAITYVLWLIMHRCGCFLSLIHSPFASILCVQRGRHFWHSL